MAAVLPPVVPRTVRDAMICCGVDNVSIFAGQTAAARIANKVFSDKFAT